MACVSVIHMTAPIEFFTMNSVEIAMLCSLLWSQDAPDLSVLSAVMHDTILYDSLARPVAQSPYTLCTE